MDTKLILETGCNNQGNKDIAFRMIDEAYKLGQIWGIKFQKRDIESMLPELKAKPRDISNSFGATYYDHRKALEFELAELQEIKQHTEKAGFKFICTAFDAKSIDDLRKINCEYIKIPSQLYSNNNIKNKLLDQPTKHSIWVSTGMHNFSEIFTNSWVYQADLIFHCISAYPFPVAECQLNTIRKLAAVRFSKNVGYSSHENEGNAIKFAVVAGANYIERHFTLDKSWKGSDHSTVSSDIKELKRIISDIENVEEILGDNRAIGFREKIVSKIYRG